MALFYYGQWKFGYDLTPALSKAREENEDAKVLSALLAGTGEKVDVNDLRLKKFSIMAATLWLLIAIS